MKSEAYKGHLAMLMANVLWGCMSPSSKIVLSSGLINAISLTTFRMLGAAIVFWIASIFTRKEHVPHEDLKHLFFAALFGIVFNQGTYIFGVSQTSPIDATIVATSTPIITMIIAAFYLKEPITGTKDGEKALNSGLPFTSRPKAVRYDYKVQMSGQPNRIRQTGFSKKTTVPGQDCAIMVCLLQKRSEDAEGNIIAKRVGTVAVKYNRSQDWHNGATYEIMYGDITHDKRYVPELMQLGTGGYYARNSKGESKLIKEVGWAGKDEHPTHLILQFTSSMGGAFVGSPGNKLWIDNVNLVY